MSLLNAFSHRCTCVCTFVYVCICDTLNTLYAKPTVALEGLMIVIVSQTKMQLNETATKPHGDATPYGARAGKRDGCRD